jgi:hypothetical protein
METMILVAGLAIAGLAGIAAAFYFSVRPGNNSSSRGRTAGSGRTGSDRADRADRIDRADRSDRTDRADRFSGRGRTLAHPSSPAASSSSRGGPAPGRTRPDHDDDYEAPSRRHAGVGHLAAGRRVHRDETAGHTVPVGLRAAGGGTGTGTGARPRVEERADREANETADAIRSTRGRRRVGFRKGAEVDEEMWPTEAFGGVSDEQFWDDMASDKPLATTARTAAPADPGSRRRLPKVPPVPNGRDADGRGRHDDSRIAGTGAYASPVGRPGPADRTERAERVDRADRTVSQPIQTGPQRMQTGPHPIPTGPQAIPTAPQPVQAGTQPVPMATRSYQPQSYQGPPQSYQPATQPAPVMGQGTRGGMPSEPRGRGRGRHANGADAGAGAVAGEDPLTSSAYALRPPGAVDGRSYSSPRRSRDLSREQYEATVAQETQSFSLADTQAASGGYPGGVPPFRQYELPAGGGTTGPNGLSGPNGPGGNGNGRAPDYRADGGRSDTGRYDQFRSDPYWSGGRPDPLRTADAYSSTNGHPYPERPYGDPAQTASTPPYGETFGYGYPVSPADDPRQPNGTRGTLGNAGNLGNLGQGRSGASGGGTGARPVYPAGNGYRGAYDPRTNGRG